MTFVRPVCIFAPGRFGCAIFDLKLWVASMELLSRIVKVFVIAVGALSGASASSASDRMFNGRWAVAQNSHWLTLGSGSAWRLIDLDKVVLGRVSGSTDPIEGYSFAGLEAFVENAQTYHDEVSRSQPAFGAGGFASSALGANASEARPDF